MTQFIDPVGVIQIPCTKCGSVFIEDFPISVHIKTYKFQCSKCLSVNSLLFNLTGETMDLQTLLKANQVTHFTVLELTRGQSVPVDLLENIIPTLMILQSLRKRIEVPILINSGYRSPEYNAKIGGAKDSMHLYFNALDFCPKGFNKNLLANLYHQISSGGVQLPTVDFKGRQVDLEPSHLGLGLYNNFIHIDTRGLLNKRAPSRWNFQN